MTNSKTPEIVSIKIGPYLFVGEGNTLFQYRGFAQVKPHSKRRLAGGYVSPYQHQYRKRREIRHEE
jgi:hypothetical protein